MLKTAIVLLLISVVAVLFQSELAYLIHYLLLANNKLAHGLGNIFSSGPTGRVILETITLFVIPVVITAVIALLWLLVRRKQMPHIVATVSVLWTILLVTILSQPGVQSAAHHFF